MIYIRAALVLISVTSAGDRCNADLLQILASETEQAFENKVLGLLDAEEFKSEYREIVAHGDRVLPILESVLSRPTEFGERRVGRALRVVADLKSGSKLRPLVRGQLLAEKPLIRLTAVEALAAIGTEDDLPALIAMLSDPEYTVRYQAVRALGKLGNKSTLLALEIWQRQAVRADESRSLPEQWLRGSLPKQIEEAKQAITDRVDSRP